MDHLSYQFNVMEGHETDEESSHHQPMHEGQEISAASIASLLGDSGRGATVTYTEGGGTIITTADGTVVQTQQTLEELQKQLQASEGGQNIVLVPPEQLPPGTLFRPQLFNSVYNHSVYNHGILGVMRVGTSH